MRRLGEAERRFPDGQLAVGAGAAQADVEAAPEIVLAVERLASSSSIITVSRTRSAMDTVVRRSSSTKEPWMP